jgi:hypothetical protein
LDEDRNELDVLLRGEDLSQSLVDENAVQVPTEPADNERATRFQKSAVLFKNLNEASQDENELRLSKTDS